ncbi:hypothetical protein J2X68_007440 [Streptomyces sp. 3330]|nr:hypothetical protein [Streptomyces sp. 3330]
MGCLRRRQQRSSQRHDFAVSCASHMDRRFGSVGDPAQHPRRTSSQDSPDCGAHLHPVVHLVPCHMARHAGLLPRPVVPGQRPTLVAELHPSMTPAEPVHDLGSGSVLDSPQPPRHACKIVLRVLSTGRPRRPTPQYAESSAHCVDAIMQMPRW